MDRCVAKIDLHSLVHNFDLLKNQGNSNYEVMAVVKANAYGHGSVEISKHLEINGCRYFGVASFEEAKELRDNEIQSNILIFGRTDPDNAIVLSRLHITQTVPSFEYAKLISDKGYPVDVHINIDTGMSRIGIYCQRPENIIPVADEIGQISNLPNIRIKGVYTHFEGAEKKDSKKSKTQFTLFFSLLEELKNRKTEIGIKHVCNSSATINYPEMHLDMVRCGIALYGYPPVKSSMNFEPVMMIQAKVIDLRTLSSGDTVSYGARFTAKEKIQVATVSIGYADGYPRSMSNNDYVIFQKQKLPVIGTVCMDAIMIDATNANIQINDVVTIFGKEKSVETIANKSNTISYEILCNIGKRVKRIYEKGLE